MADSDEGLNEKSKRMPFDDGHRACDHYHRSNTKATGKNDKYLDYQGKPCPKRAEKGHLYSPNNEKWEF